MSVLWDSCILSVEFYVFIIIISVPVPLAFRMDIVLSWGVVIFGICVLRGSCLDQKTSERDIEGEFGISTETLNTPLKKDASTISSPKWHTYCRRSVDLSATFLTRNFNVTYIPAMAFAVWPETEVSQWWCHGKKISVPLWRHPDPTPPYRHTLVHNGYQPKMGQ